MHTLKEKTNKHRYEIAFFAQLIPQNILFPIMLQITQRKQIRKNN